MGTDFKELRILNQTETRIRIKDSTNHDTLITQAIYYIEELNKVTNILSKRLRDWHSTIFPEVDHFVSDHEMFTKLIESKTIDELKEDLSQRYKLVEPLMISNVSEEDYDMIRTTAKEVKRLYELKDEQLDYVQRVMQKYCPNTLAITGVSIGGKLISELGSIRKMSTVPSSTIQLLGAEKALFRHLKSGAKPPKYGYIINHPFILKAKRNEKGKVARMLADKISIAAKIDYFKGEFIGEELKNQIKNKFFKEQP